MDAHGHQHYLADLLLPLYKIAVVAQDRLRDKIGFGKKHLTAHKLKKLPVLKELEEQMTFPTNAPPGVVDCFRGTGKIDMDSSESDSPFDPTVTTYQVTTYHNSKIYDSTDPEFNPFFPGTR